MVQSLTFSIFISFNKLSLLKKISAGLSLILLLPASAHAEISEFALFVGNTIKEVYKEDNPAFRLTKVGKGGIVIHGEEEQQPYSSITCKKEVSINIGSFRKIENRLYGDPKLGVFSVSLCDKNKMGHTKAKELQGNSKNVFKLIAANNPEKEAEHAQLLSSINMENIKNGAVIYRFPVLLIGHGAMFYYTSIAIPGDEGFVFIIQYGLNDRYCEEAPDTMICRDPENSIKKIAQLLLEKWPNQ